MTDAESVRCPWCDDKIRAIGGSRRCCRCPWNSDIPKTYRYPSVVLLVNGVDANSPEYRNTSAYRWARQERMLEAAAESRSGPPKKGEGCF